jgi:glutamate N-acetyltransferase/amino-acid N-acetyltransferase
MRLPQGFKFGGITCGIKASGKRDLALITTDQPAVMAGVYTQNVVCAASIDWNRNLTPSKAFRAVVVNSGNANACTGQQGIDDNCKMASLVADLLGADAESVAVLSTGVIGHHLPMDKVATGIIEISAIVGTNEGNFTDAADAITTTDQSRKVAQRTVLIDGDEVSIVAMAKGAGMIGPNMATMLAVVCTDANIDEIQASRILKNAADHSFNRISVEGHTSTNDALLLICSGSAGDPISESQHLDALQQAVTGVCLETAKLIPADGEGATHLIEINVSGAASDKDADTVARTVAASNLVKTAITGSDPNWGRIVSAAGYAGVEMQQQSIALQINGYCVFQDGEPVEFDAAEVSQSIAESFETNISLQVGDGDGAAVHWTSDLTVDYVRFNSEYTT